MATNFSSVSNFNEFKDIFATSREHGFTVISINIRSLRKYWEEFRQVAESVADVVDAFIIVETNVPEDCTNIYNLKGYKAHFMSRQKRRGGV